MVPELERLKDEIATLSRAHGVVRLDLFGSAARGEDFDPERSDVDFLVKFGSGDFDSYLRFKEALQRATGRSVDLTTEKALRNPYLRRSIEEDLVPYYHEA